MRSRRLVAAVSRARTALGALGAMAVIASVGLVSSTVSAQTRTGSPRAADDLARARILDQQGAKAYADGRYNDAIRYFEEAHRLGGPPFELWNIAKCHVHLDQPEQAAEMLERYLATPTLPAEDREEATQQLEALRKRPSTVTIASRPSGAAVTVDGRPAEGGKTPTSFNVPPGSHTIRLELPTHAPYVQTFDARYGRAILLDVPLAKSGAPPPAPTAPVQVNPYDAEEVRRIALRGHLGIMLPRYGSVGGSAHVQMDVSGTYRFADVGATSFAAGGAVFLTGDSWSNTIAAPVATPQCGVLRDQNGATALSMFAIGTAGWQIVPRLRAHAIGGFGLAGYLAGDLGGDVFTPSCTGGPGARPALLLGTQLDYALTPLVRLSAMPIVLQLQPSFAGTRSDPIDTSGIWMRATIAIGAGVDL